MELIGKISAKMLTFVVIQAITPVTILSNEEGEFGFTLAGENPAYIKRSCRAVPRNT